MSLKIPENFTEFLYWIKEQTETFWSIDPNESDADFVCDDWAYGAKWIGMKENEIDNIEKENNIKFSNYHREFLKVLHTTDKKQILEYTETFDEDAEVLFEERSYFYNWNTDIENIKRELNYVYKDLLKATLGGFWLKSWGIRPESIDKRKETFVNWYNNAPKLIPIKGHRFVISEPKNTDNAILSIRGTDTIIYGVNMRNYLLSELREELGLYKSVYNKETNEYDDEQEKILKEALRIGYKLQNEIEIPIWKEFLITNGYNPNLIKK
ncbi:hypothetical protein PG911_07935 [Tenacibaculum ovolyticum]|uniref:hypothetical protein n=1 Tax=Tenacibaculum ovolyticum TaxID=104270 RepID=UPI0022F3B94C|nr:hypothetical protein [Tenacibaculum ovolyticum]WBX78171.1 hypothetical protein PG911_07935 [Tenacibaculum ovolyticum]